MNKKLQLCLFVLLVCCFSFLVVLFFIIFSIYKYYYYFSGEIGQFINYDDKTQTISAFLQYYIKKKYF